MEYMYNGVQLKERNLQGDQNSRLLMYYINLQALVSEKKTMKDMGKTSP